MLVKPSTTRWGAIQESLKSLKDGYTCIEELFSQPEFIVHGKAEERSNRIKLRDYITSSTLIHNINKALKLIDQICIMIKVFESDKPLLSDVFHYVTVIRGEIDKFLATIRVWRERHPQRLYSVINGTISVKLWWAGQSTYYPLLAKNGPKSNCYSSISKFF